MYLTIVFCLLLCPSHRASVRSRAERKEDEDVFKQQPLRPAYDPLTLGGAIANFFRRWGNTLMFGSFFAYFIYFMTKDGSEAPTFSL